MNNQEEIPMLCFTIDDEEGDFGQNQQECSEKQQQQQQQQLGQEEEQQQQQQQCYPKQQQFEQEYRQQIMQQTTSQVNDVVGIMIENVGRVMEREVKLSDLNERADALQHGALQFETTATRIKRKQCLAKLKWTIILCLVTMLLIVVLVALLWPKRRQSYVLQSKAADGQ